MKKPHPRPEKDFRVTCVAWELDIERRQVEGGFEPMLSHFKSLNINWSDCAGDGWLVFRSANSSAIGIFEIA
jgi:hypothetical protein